MNDVYIVRIRPRRWLIGTVAALVVLLVLAGIGYASRTHVLTWIGSQLVHADGLERADVIVVLAGGTPAREIEAADLYLAGLAPLVVLTRNWERPGLAALRERGVTVPDVLDQRLRYLRELGVPVTAIEVLDGIAESTAHEARLLVAWWQQAHPCSLIVVTSAFHTGRARFVLNGAFDGTGVRLLYRPASVDSFDPQTVVARPNDAPQRSDRVAEADLLPTGVPIAPIRFLAADMSANA